MKQLLRRLSRVADSSQCRPLLRSPKKRRSGPDRGAGHGSSGVPEGHIPVYVGEEMERFVVPANLLGRPIFVELLKRSAQEYGYEQRGVLRIPCPVDLFERVLRALRDGGGKEEDYADELAWYFREELVPSSQG